MGRSFRSTFIRLTPLMLKDFKDRMRSINSDIDVIEDDTIVVLAIIEANSDNEEIRVVIFIKGVFFVRIVYYKAILITTLRNLAVVSIYSVNYDVLFRLRMVGIEIIRRVVVRNERDHKVEDLIFRVYKIDFTNELSKKN